MHQLIAIADDLSGAAESAARLLPGIAQNAQSVLPRIVLLPSEATQLTAAVTAALEDPDGGTGGGRLPGGGTVGGSRTGRPLVLDSDNRRFGHGEAGERLRLILEAAMQADPSAAVVLKIDSLLRGPLSSQLAALAQHGLVILSPALPELHRTTVSGVVLADGVPLDQTSLWHAEDAPAPASVAEAIAPLNAVRIELSTVRGGVARLASELRSKASQSAVVICDAETSGDLDAIVHAGLGFDNARFAGSSALLAALRRGLDTPEPAGNVQPAGPLPQPFPRPMPGGKHPLLVVGSASRQAREQLKVLTSAGIGVVAVSPAELLAGSVTTGPITEALENGAVAVTVAEDAVDPSLSGSIAEALAQLVAPLAVDRPLVLTGGETARVVLTALNVRRLTAVAQIEHGAVLSQTDSGTLVATRPGSFGGPNSLLTIAKELQSYLPLTTAMQPSLPGKGHPMNTVDPADLPIVAVTMGDGAGVGPEVVVAAVLDPQSNAECRPVVIGDALRLRQAADVLGVQAGIRTISDVSEAEFTPGRVNVIDLALLPEDLPWGQLSAIAGHAAYEYIRVASELAMAGIVQAICTAPLNKEALHAAGHIFPGHTELLAQLTGTEEVSMMLSTPKIKVIHVTTHIGLMDAVRKINPDLVHRTIRRGHEALQRAGIARPKIGVCAINPHAGEGGLFGQGEEAEKIEPGVKAAQAEGIDVTGPLPADTLFFLAGRGDYDLVVAMYHDQGHGPVKVLGIEAGVNITVGLPVIRTSVDHGTAFDIAGKGIADSRSMVEALHQAAEMATRPSVKA